MDADQVGRIKWACCAHTVNARQPTKARPYQQMNAFNTKNSSRQSLMDQDIRRAAQSLNPSVLTLALGAGCAAQVQRHHSAASGRPHHPL